MNARLVAPRAPARDLRAHPVTRSAPDEAPVRIALLGVGTVGKALLQRLDELAGSPLVRRLQLVHVANSRHVFVAQSGCRADGAAVRWSPGAGLADGLHQATAALGNGGVRVLVDATASEAVASHHPHWLAQGIHVVTACKLGPGTSLERWRAIRAACARGGARYGDAATVGAGLPLLRSLRELRAGGDAIHAVAGVLSGSLAWLFHHYDGMRPFSTLVRAARQAGFTEPDPREDLSGQDVRRKLLILARAAGFALEAEAVEVAPLVPAALADAARGDVDGLLPVLDVPLRERFSQARRRGQSLRFLARLQRDGNGIMRARVGLEALAAGDPLCGGAGTDNRVAIWSDRYRERPLLIQGPGAGAEVTAAALLGDVLGIVHG